MRIFGYKVFVCRVWSRPIRIDRLREVYYCIGPFRAVVSKRMGL